MDFTTFKSRLNNAFRYLRSCGVIARQNFSCCPSCAGYEIAQACSEMPSSRQEKVAGTAFYTRQTWSRFENSRNPKGLYVQYGQVNVEGKGAIGLPTRIVGELVRNAFENAGLDVEWDGDPCKSIYVRFADA